MMQNLCTMMAGGMCSCCMHDERHDGVLLQHDDGHVQVRDDRQRAACMTCTSGDKMCCDMIQACCDCMTA